MITMIRGADKTKNEAESRLIVEMNRFLKENELLKILEIQEEYDDWYYIDWHVEAQPRGNNERA